MSQSYDFNDGIPEDTGKEQSNSWVVWLLILLPLGIAIGTGWGLYRYYGQEEQLNHKASVAISSNEIKDILSHYRKHFGDRGFATEAERDQLLKVSKNLSGELQYQNSFLLSYSDKGGYVESSRTWKTHWADIKGQTDEEKVFCIVTSYDGVRSLRNAAKIAIMVTVAKSLAADTLDYTLRFVFVPAERSIEEQEAWVKKQCFKKGEKPIGMFFMAHGKGNEETATSKDSWAITEGNKLWGQELLKGSRVMSYGTSSLHHGVFNSEKEGDGSDLKRVGAAAHGLRKIMVMIMGGDR